MLTLTECLSLLCSYPLPPLSQEDEGTPKELYYRAAQIGASYQGRASIHVCARFYPTCPHNAKELINIFVTEDVQTNEIDNNDQPSSHLRPPSSPLLPFYIHPRQHLSVPSKPAVAVTPNNNQRQQQHKLQVNAPQARLYQPGSVSLPVSSPKQRFVVPPVA